MGLAYGNKDAAGLTMLTNTLKILEPNVRNWRSKNFMFILDTLHDYFESKRAGIDSELVNLVKSLANSPWEAISKLYNENLMNIAAVLSSKDYTPKNMNGYVENTRTLLHKILNSNDTTLDQVTGLTDREALAVKVASHMFSFEDKLLPFSQQPRKSSRGVAQRAAQNIAAKSQFKQAKSLNISRAKQWSYYSIVKLMLAKGVYRNLRKQCAINGVQTTSFGWDRTMLKKWFEQHNSYIAIDALDVSSKRSTLQGSGLMNTTVVTAAQLFDPASTTTNAKGVRFVFLNNNIPLQRNVKTGVFKIPQGDITLMNYTFKFDVYVTQDVFARVRVSPMVLLTTDQLNTFTVQATLTPVRRNSVSSKYVRYIRVSPTHSINGFDIIGDGLYYTFDELHGGMVVCKKLQGVSVAETELLFSHISTKYTLNANEKKDLAKLMFDIKRAGDFYQFELASQITSAGTRVVVASEDYLACAIALENNHEVIFENSGVFYPFLFH